MIGRIALLAITLGLSLCVQADPTDTDVNRPLLLKSSQVLTHPEQHADPELAKQAARIAAQASKNPQMQSLAEQAKTQAMQALQAAAGGAPVEPMKDQAGTRYRIFVSQSLPDATLKAIVDLARQRSDVVIDIRGFRKDQTLGAVFRWIRAAIATPLPLQHDPDVQLDPAQFAALNVRDVPTIAVYVDGKPLAWERGTTGLDHITNAVSAGKRGDLGKWGTVYPVQEEDLAQRMQENAAKIDWTAMRDHAVGNFWKKQPFTEITAATTDRVFSFDPSFTVSQDIPLPNGGFLARKGEVVNPLDRVPFDQALIVFDATDKDQILTVAHLVKDTHAARLTLLASNLDRDHAMEQVTTLSNQFGWPVQLLNGQIRDAFHITHVPCVVEASQRRFHVHEYRPGTYPAEEGHDAHTHSPTR